MSTLTLEQPFECKPIPLDSRTEFEEKSIKLYPKDYANGFLKGREIYENGFPFKYLSRVSDICLLKWVKEERGYAYSCGLYEGYEEEEINNIKTNLILPD